jgi:AcrR family transcriptional regulator
MIEKANEEPGVKEKILESALGSFALKGYHGTSVKDIAQDAGVNKSLLFYYFNSKENLYKSIVHYATQKAKVYLYDEPDKAMNFHEKIDKVISGYIRFFSETKHLPGIVLQSIFGLGPDLSLSLEETSRYMRAPLVNLLEEGIASGDIKIIDTEITAKAIMGMIGIFFHIPCQPQHPEEEIRKNLCNIINNGIYARSN